MRQHEWELREFPHARFGWKEDPYICVHCGAEYWAEKLSPATANIRFVYRSKPGRPERKSRPRCIEREETQEAESK